jgi:hypothetical protein
VSVHKSKRNKIKTPDGFGAKPVFDAKTEAMNADAEAELVKFEHHKEALITVLRNAHAGSMNGEPFDEHRSWVRLTRLAYSFFLQERVKQETMPAADRKARLDELAKSLKRSRIIVEAAMQGDVGGALFSAWCEGTDYPLVSFVRNPDGSLALIRMPETMFKKAMASLAALETAALLAAGEAHAERAKRGRPTETKALPAGYIEVLAAQYRDGTGAKLRASTGAFVPFVYAFLTAIGRASITEDYVVELVQAARSRAASHLNEWEPSPFDD